MPEEQNSEAKLMAPSTEELQGMVKEDLLKLKADIITLAVIKINEIEQMITNQEQQFKNEIESTVQQVEPDAPNWIQQFRGKHGLSPEMAGTQILISIIILVKLLGLF